MDAPIPTPTPGVFFKKREIFTGSLFIIIGFIVTFASGYSLNSTLQGEKTPLPTPIPQPTQAPLPTSDPEPEEPIVTNELSDVGFYMSDTIFMIAKETPHQTLIATVTRKDQADGSVTQTSRVSYYDGISWTRDTQTQTQDDLTISSNSLVTSWDTKIDSSKVLREATTGAVDIASQNLSFDTGILVNEIPLRSLPEYTKFMAEGDGQLQINGKTLLAHVLQTRIYSFNQTQIPHYDPALGITTDWLAFWDEAGNFYHVDATDVAKPSELYKSHQIVVQKNADAATSQLFAVEIEKIPEFDPENYTITLSEPLNSVLKLERGPIVEKYSGLGATWHTGMATGTVTVDDQEIEGYGIVEYLHF